MSKSLEELTLRQHEQVAIFHRPEVGLVAIIAVHDTTLGPALGGCRMHQYQSLDDALFDVLRLAEGMTYKNALAGLNLGGGKSVIVADRALREGREALFLAFGECVESLSGRYITAEDMGTSVADIEIVHRVSEHVSGTDPEQGGGGDPSPYTAQGVFDGIKSCVERVYGSRSLSGRRVAIQGMGAVGTHLAEHLRREEAELIVADTREEQCRTAVERFAARVVSVDEIYSVESDVFSPCAHGAILNEGTIPILNCRIVAGAANNQLATPEDELRLQERGIIYAPDFAINAGGVILCAEEKELGGFDATRLAERVGRIGRTVAEILERSATSGKSAGQVAVELAQARIASAKQMQAQRVS